MHNQQEAIKIYKNRPKYTNCFVDYNHFLNLIKNEIFFTIDENIFILKSENGIFKFLYFTNDLKEICKVDNYLKDINTPISLEFVSKSDKPIPNFEEFGFKPYKIFSRYSVLKENRIPPKLKNAIIKLADKKDAFDIHTIAKDVFDPLCDFIPSVIEIEDFIDNQELFIIKNKDILGFVIYKKVPYGYDFRLSCVTPKYRAGLIGYNFVANLPSDGKRCTCWIEDNNSPAIRLNESIGFTRDGLKNHIFVRNITN